MQTPLEGLLRPPVEWYSTAVSLAGVGLLCVYPESFLLTANMAYMGAVGLSAFALWRFRQGYKIFRYQRNLKRMPKYTMSSHEMPVSQKQLFLGRGFLWTPTHTQRLRDLDLSYNLHYRYPSKLYQWARQKEFAWENRQLLRHLIPLLKADFALNPFRPYPDIGGEPCLQGVSEEEKDITLSLTERAGHTVVIGTTGVGKTRLAELLIAQDIRRGDVVIVLDPKGDADLLKRIYIEAKNAGRESDVLICHLGFPEHSCRYNAIGNFTKITQVATRLTNGLPSTGEAAAFKEFAWKYVNLAAKTLVSMGVRPTYKLINFYITKLDQLLIRYCEDFVAKYHADYESWINQYLAKTEKEDGSQKTRQEAIQAYAKNYLEETQARQLHSLENDILMDLAAACRLDKTYYDKITASIGPLLEKLTTGQVSALLSPDYNDLNDKRPVLDWLQVIRNQKIVYVGMDALTDNVISSAVGNAMLSDLVSVAGHLYNFGVDHGFEGIIDVKTPLPRICLHSDEFNEVIGDEFIPILNKARGAGFYVTAYTQTWSDVEARLNSTAKAGQVAGNLNTIIMLRTKEAKTVDMVLNQLSTVPILRVIPASVSSDTPHGEEGIFYQSSNEDRFAHTDMRLIEQNDILNLPKGQAFCLLEGGKLYKIRVPLPVQDNIDIPSSVNKLIGKMREQRDLRKPD
jgi:conjugative coupling factor TraD (TOL family)